MRRRIRWRIALPYLILMVVMMVVFIVLTIHHIRQEEYGRWEDQLLSTAQLIASETKDNDWVQGDAGRFSGLALTKSKILGSNVTFLDMEGNILGTSLNSLELTQDLLENPSVRKALADGQSAQVIDEEITAAVTFYNSEGEGLGIVLLHTQTSTIKLEVGWFIWLAVIIVVISSGSVILLALIVSDISFKPVEVLSIAAQQMSMGNFNNLEFPETAYELTDLSRSLQTMASQLGMQIDALTSERVKSAAVLNQMTDGVLIADANGRVQLLNPAAERLFQVTEETGLGRSIVEVMRYHQLVELWRRAKDGQRQSTMLEIGSQHMFLQVVAIPLKIALPGSTMILFQDLTQLRKLETVRRDFISNVSHELRTPLASLKALAETLQESALEDPPAAHRFILRMETEIDNLTQLVNELLELSRIDSGKVPLSFQRIQPCKLLMTAYERMTLQAERAGLELIMDCPQDLPIVFADPDRIAQVLINLIHNAVKFTPPGGRITLSAYRDNEQIVFYVRDTGVGIDSKDLSRIFERFYKADRARTGGGTGLGLSIARHMVESHSGYIWVESEEDVGSTFYFTLPVA